MKNIIVIDEAEERIGFYVYAMYWNREKEGDESA